MKTLRIYIDTSVLGGYFDSEFERDTKMFFSKIRKGEYKIVISDLTERELLNAPENVKSLLKELKLFDYEFVPVTNESVNLANLYINENVVGRTSFDDCIHISTATINKVDILVSWNFKHIVNIKRIRGYNSVNIKNGYQTLEIRSPKELIDYEE